MTLNLMPLVILFGLGLLLVGRTNDQQTQPNAMNMSICVLAIRGFQIADQAFLQTTPVRRIVEAGRRPQHEIVAPPQCPQHGLPSWCPGPPGTNPPF